MRRQRKCRKCHELFLPDPRGYRPIGNSGLRSSSQHFCSKAECRRESRRCSHRNHVRKNPRCRAQQLMSARRWRKKNSGYWRRWRREHPEKAKRNKVLQRRRDAKAQENLANINTIAAVYSEKLKRIERLIDLANINMIEVPWTAVSEEIVAVLRWSNRLANINPIGKRGVSSAQSRA